MANMIETSGMVFAIGNPQEDALYNHDHILFRVGATFRCLN